MVEDQDDRPMTPLIVVILAMGLTLFIIVATFDSCTDFEKDAVQKYCGDIRFEVGGILGQKYPCYDDDGFFYFSFLNVGEVDLEGVSIKFKNFENNHSDYTPRLSQVNVKIQMGLRPGVTFQHLNITPLSFYEEINDTVRCYGMGQTITKLEKCDIANIGNARFRNFN